MFPLLLTLNSSQTFMQSLTHAHCNHVLQLLDKGRSSHSISTTTGISVGSISNIHSKHCLTLFKSVGGHPCKLSPADTQYATHLITSQKAENATQVAKTLQNMTNTSSSVKTVQQALRSTAVTKQKQPFLSKKHRRLRMDFAEAHKDWTVEDWKKVIWSDETKINYLGSDGKKWVWKMPGEGLSDGLVQGTVRFGGGSLMIWCCMFWEVPGYATKINGRINADPFWVMNFNNHSGITTKSSQMSFFSRTMTPNTRVRRPKTGSKTVD